jgi:RsiW-degrading membrane proteinase PrsW (M82 family)
MVVVLPVFVSFAPLFLVLFIVARPRILPLSVLFFAVALGLCAVAAASVLQVLLDPVTGAIGGILFPSFIESALIEELSKATCIFGLCAFFSRPTRPLSVRAILSAALLVGVSFSSFETVSYALKAPLALWLRPLSALPVHASAAVVAGFLVLSCGRASGETAIRTGKAFCFFFIAIFLHGACNAFLSLSGVFIIPALVCVLSAVLLAFRLWTKAVGS